MVCIMRVKNVKDVKNNDEINKVARGEHRRTREFERLPVLSELLFRAAERKAL